MIKWIALKLQAQCVCVFVRIIHIFFFAHISIRYFFSTLRGKMCVDKCICSARTPNENKHTLIRMQHNEEFGIKL